MLEVRRGRAEPIEKLGTVIRFKVPLAGLQSEEWKAAFRQCIDLDVESFHSRVTLQADHLTFLTEEANVESGMKKVDEAIAAANGAVAHAADEKMKAKQLGRQAEVERRQELDRLKDKFKDL